MSPPKILGQLSWLEAAIHLPAGLLGGKAGKTVEGYFGGLVGPRNFRNVLSPFLAAVPSQCADELPRWRGRARSSRSGLAGRTFPRSFGLQGGLQTLCEAVAAMPGIQVLSGVEARARCGAAGDGFAVELSDGRTIEAAGCAVALPAQVSASLVERDWPRVAARPPQDRDLDAGHASAWWSRARRSRSPRCAFLVAADDVFYSAVTRDTFPDASWRAFAFHFKDGRATREEKLQRAAATLGVEPSDFAEVVEARRTLPAPRLGHAGIVAELAGALSGERLALTGNYFDGLAIEDCVQRSFAEWRRVAG